MSKAKINPYKKKVAASVALQYVFEAKDLHMNLSTFIDWLKHKAGYTTVYDELIANYKNKSDGKHGEEDRDEPSGDLMPSE